jgi:hypothetical protein
LNETFKINRSCAHRTDFNRQKSELKKAVKPNYFDSLGAVTTKNSYDINMTFLLTFLFTFAVVLLVLLVFYKLGVPVYRIESSNVVCLLELVMAGEATDRDWDVFIGVPIPYDPDLDEIRLLCADITEREMWGDRSPVAFSPRGYLELQAILTQLLMQIDDVS